MGAKSGPATTPTPESAPTPIKAGKPEGMCGRLGSVSKTIAHHARDIFEGKRKASDCEVADRFKNESLLLQPIQFNISETNTTLRVCVEVPGFDEKNLDVLVEPTRLVITGKRETGEKEEKEHSREVLHVIDLPAEVDAENATARLTSGGILAIQVQKTEKAKNAQRDGRAA